MIDECLAGRVTCDYYLGHPHGFHSHYYLAEVHHCVVLEDPASLMRSVDAAERLLEEVRARISDTP